MSAATKQDQVAALDAAVSPSEDLESSWPLDDATTTSTAPADIAGEVDELLTDEVAAGTADETSRPDADALEQGDEPVSLNPAWLDDAEDRLARAPRGSVGNAFGRGTPQRTTRSSSTRPRQVAPAPPDTVQSKSEPAAQGDDALSSGDESAIDVPSDDSSVDGDLDREVRDSEALEQETDADDRPLPSAAAPYRPKMTPELRSLSNRVRRVLGMYFRRQLNSRDHNPWEMMHTIIAYGVHAKIHRGGPKGPTVNAVSYLCWNGTCHGLELLYLDRDRVNARKGPYVQGHYAQLLAILAQSRVPRDYPLRVGDRRFTIEDLIETEKLTCDEGMELTFKLISFAHYCDSEMTWQNDKGEDWDIPRLIKEELRAPILSNAACGGTHRLTALAYAVRMRGKQGYEIDGHWLRAQKYLNDYHRYNFSLQNSDGSFSTEWFRRREARDDLDRRLQTSGHILEWFVYSLPEKQLTDPRVIKAVRYLSGILAAQPNREWEIGPLGHALHALVLYDQRVFKAAEAPVEKPVAQAKAGETEPTRDERESQSDAAESARSPRAIPARVRRSEVTPGADEAADAEDAEPAASAGAVSPEDTASVASDDAHTAPTDEADNPTDVAQQLLQLTSDEATEPEIETDDEATTPTDGTDVPEVARRGILRRPFARRPARQQSPRSSEGHSSEGHGPTSTPESDPGAQLGQPTEAATAVAEPDLAEPMSVDGAADIDEPVPASDADDPNVESPADDDVAWPLERAPSTNEGPQLFGDPTDDALEAIEAEPNAESVSEPLLDSVAEPAIDSETEPAVGPVLEPATTATTPPDSAEPPATDEVSPSAINDLPQELLDPPPASHNVAPPASETSRRSSSRRTAAPPVVQDEANLDRLSDADDELLDEGLLDAEPAASTGERRSAEPPPAGHITDEESPAGGNTSPPTSSRRPRVDSRYARPLPEYTPYPERRAAPTSRSPAPQPALRQAPPAASTPQPGDPHYGQPPTQGAGRARPVPGRNQSARPSDRPGADRPTVGRPTTSRPTRSLWPWTDDERQSTESRDNDSSDRPRLRRFFFGPGQ
ncbi:MAG: hypothetical protein AB7O68_20740 [Pirellulales bacterium]